MKILLVEDDRLTASVLSELLTAQHYIVELAIDGEMALSLASFSSYDLLILDVVIPKLDGLSVCRQLRSQGYQKPILLLTHKISSLEVVQGLDAGADDYVTKPYNLPELLARIRALLRRGEIPIAPKLLTWEKLSVNPVSAEVTYDGQAIALTPKEYGLLGLFLRHPQQVFSRSDIVDRLWSIDATPAEGTVTNLIKDLRQKLKASGMTADLLETIYGLGYRLKAPPEKSAQTPKSINNVLNQYQSTFAERVQILEQVEQSKRLNSALRQTAIEEAHKLAGVLGSFGYETGTRLAKLIEQWLIQPSDRQQFSQLLAQLKQELQKPPASPTSQSFSSEFSVLVIHCNSSFTRQLKADAIRLNLQISSDQAILPTVILLDLSSKTTIDAKLTQLQSCQAQFPMVPIIVMDQQGELSERVAVSRAGVQRFLHQPTTYQALDAIVQALPKARSTQAKVMIIDDDELMLENVRVLLEPWGLTVTTLQDPTQFWNTLTETVPDLLLLDLQMPTFSGIDLCRVVRQDATWGDLPILVVTAHTEFESIQQVFAAGADDFIEKPIAGPELVTRVISRIDRSRLQRELETLKRRIGQ